MGCKNSDASAKPSICSGIVFLHPTGADGRIEGAEVSQPGLIAIALCHDRRTRSIRLLNDVRERSGEDVMPVSFVQGTVPVGGLKLICGNVCVNAGTSDAVAVNAPLPVGLLKNAPFSAATETPVASAACVDVAVGSTTASIVSRTSQGNRIAAGRLLGCPVGNIALPPLPIRSERRRLITPGEARSCVAER